jgi:hypothetical protein
MKTKIQKLQRTSFTIQVIHSPLLQESSQSEVKIVIISNVFCGITIIIIIIIIIIAVGKSSYKLFPPKKILEIISCFYFQSGI